MEKRILVTGVGRRVELMQAFRQAAQNLNINLKLIGADMAGTAPALAYCDYYRSVCAMKDPDYISQLLTICKEEKIDLLMPTIDTDLQVLADNADRFREIGVIPMISASDKIAICRDKNYTSAFFVECDLLAPAPCNDYNEYKGPYPCFIKPKDGSSSIDAYKVETQETLPAIASRVEDYIIQPFIDGTEYTVDIFCDFDGNPIYITPRIRLAVRSGEVLKTEIKDDAQIIAECKKLIDKYKPCGPITVQLIRQKTTGDDYYIEINPRYGGGAPLSMKAGARSAEAILRLLCGEKLEYVHAIEDGAVYSRFDQSVCITPGLKGQKVKGIIFDMDDSLYPELQYVKSGYKQVAEWIVNNCKLDKQLDAAMLSDKLWHYFELRRPAIDDLVDEIFGEGDTVDLNDGTEYEPGTRGQSRVEENASMNKAFVKAKLLEIYRNQIPEIAPFDGVISLLKELKEKGIKIGMITDGRVEGQNAKIEALGIRECFDDIIITDELGGAQFRKPCDIAFRIMQNRWRIPFEQLVYVGDNVTKDFIAPGQLGMQSVYVRNTEGIYFKEGAKLPVNVIDRVTDICDVIDL